MASSEESDSEEDGAAEPKNEEEDDSTEAMLEGLDEDLKTDVKFIQHMGGPDAELRMQWVLSGEKLEDFTKTKYKKKLQDQAVADFKLDFVRGTTSYEDKLEALRRIKRRRQWVKNIVTAPLRAPGRVQRSVKRLGQSYLDSFEPKYRQVARIRDQNLAAIAAHEATEMAVTSAVPLIRQARYDSYKEDTRMDHERGILIEKEKPTDEIRAKLIEEEREREKQKEMNEFKERRRRTIEIFLQRRKQKDEDERKAQNDRVKAVRDWRVSHYTKVEQDARKEAAERQHNKLAALDQKDANLAASLGDDMKRRDVGMAFEQTKGPDLTSSVGHGIFGDDPVFETQPSDEYNAAVDQGEVEVFSGRPVVSHQVQWDRLAQLESKCKKTLEESKAWSRYASKNLETAANLDVQRRRFQVERAQLRAEHDLLLHRVAGPPRREPSTAEKEATHRRMTRDAYLR